MSKSFKRIIELDTVIVGSGCAGLNCADTLYELGVKSIAIVTEGLYMGTSINTGSDKQTYYKLSCSGGESDSVYDMAKTLFSGGCMQGYHALCEAACSLRAFYKLISIGVDFPRNAYGEYVGYRTDHDYRKRATSCGPLTSKFMAERFIEQIKKKEIPVYEGLRVVKVLVRDGAASGILAIDDEGELTLFKARHTVLATGGPSGIYASSVYPKSQTGSLSVALSCGASGVNLTEWQYGIASTDFRWNLSGTYMQVIPRFISRDKNGYVREFLGDYIKEDIFGLIFQKGYNWPFSPSKLYGENLSSRIDMAVYAEVCKGNEVYLDYMHEPEGFTPEVLPREAYEYLKSSGVIQTKTPIARLREMNERAYQLYLTNGIDLESEPLRIDVCAQHCNGGISCDENYMSRDVKNLFVCGECSGTFGVARPGGTALNNTQVSSMRAAEYIKGVRSESELISELDALSLCKDVIEMKDSLHGEMGLRDILEYRRKIGSIMSEKCSFVRSVENARSALTLLEELEAEFTEYNAVPSGLLKDALINRDLLLSAKAVAYAQLVYCESGKKSRGSYLVCDGGEIDFDGISCETDNETLFNVYFKDGDFSFVTEKVTHIPGSEQWFEKVYNNYYGR